MSDTTNTQSPNPSPDSSPPPPEGAPVIDLASLPHDSLVVNIIASASICWFIAALFVALRFYTRGVLIKVIGGSDWSILVALIFAGATCGGVIEQATHGAGQHVWDLDPNDTPSAIAWGRAAWYGILFYLITLCFSKISILLLYIHLFTFKWARLAGQILLGVVIITHLFMALATFTACIPLNSYWDFSVEKKYCHAQSVWWSNTGMHMVTDFLIFLLPMPVVWSIRLPRRQKLALSAVFGFGFLVCFISILRLLQLIRVQTDLDFTYAAAELSYLTAVEVNGAIVCACVMTLKPFIARFFPRLLSSRTSGSSNGRSGAVDNTQYYHANGGINGRGPPTIGSRRSKGVLGGGAGNDLGPLASPTDLQYGFQGLGSSGEESEMFQEKGGSRRNSKHWLGVVDGGAIAGRGNHDRYVEIGDATDSGWGVDVEKGKSSSSSPVSPRSPASRGGPGEDARRDYMLRTGRIESDKSVPDGRVRVETRVTVTKEMR
ncbi:hypothetical protein QBC40DRAFT_195205 [Triangularia verruculosa]|uniref:Rhodopsin domain-containing protein n=1 Tax=Triangularia verruculosa TaxID=2587418 RepID=A0AAN6XLF8_9PEZI|nr:hypothetical protein QBC40DRAFT_195205 [Triangularia verruculosa]